MLESSIVKGWLHKRGLSRSDKLLIVLSTFDQPCQIKEMKVRARQEGFAIPKVWNISSILLRSDGLAFRTPEGWEISDEGRQRLNSLGLKSVSTAAASVATDLRALLADLTNEDSRAFMDETIKCHEHSLFRSAVVMSWLAAVHVLQSHVIHHHLAAFNAEASRVDAKWKAAKTADGLSKMKESDFLDRLEAISVIGSDVKKDLKACLTRRNSCGHPNSMKFGPNAVAHQLETLLLNVFKVFQ